jgi:dihydroorotate dehydrogenase (fumarate)/dihydroorotate dehydrogenase
MDVYSLVRPVLFRVPPDAAHDLAKVALRRPWLWGHGAAGDPDPRLATDLAGLRLRSPIGLAPGFDKNGDLVAGLARLGFGYLVVGSITPEPRAGNPKPRLLRYVQEASLANCMGMPNVGLEGAVRLLSRPRPHDVPVIASVAGFDRDELLRSAAVLEPHVDAIEIGLVCRHTPETFEMSELPTVATLADGLARQRRKPVFVKLPPHFDDAERRRALSIVDIWADAGLDGVSLSGTRQIDEPRLSVGRGGVAGRRTTDDALRILGDVADRAGGRLAIKAAGGVMDGRVADRFLSAGATTVELYSAFVYRGWSVAQMIARELLEVRDGA